MASLDTDIRQLFAHSVLETLDRVAEADVQFTYKPADVYMSAFAEAFARLESPERAEYDEELLRLAQVFERFLTHPKAGVAPTTAGLVAASLYWLGGYSANALVMARAVRRAREGSVQPTAEMLAVGAGPARLLLGLLLRDISPEADWIGGTPVARALTDYLRSGDPDARERAKLESEALADRQLAAGAVDEYVAARLLSYAIERLARVSLWASIEGRSSAPAAAWRDYVAEQFRGNVPLIDLWPSQRAAIAKGLLDGRSSLTVRTPTSSGKTKMTELAFVNDLFTDSRRCLYLAPFRALVSEIELDLGRSLASLGIPVASLYGGSEANELEVELSKVARVVIATPEKIAAVLKLTGGTLADFGTVVLDEGHLLDSGARGVSYELQLSSLRAQLNGGAGARTVFLSAVLPNSSEIAAWLGGSVETLVAEDWHPTSTRIGVVTWPPSRAARLDYRDDGARSLFVPRILEEVVWSELNPRTRRQNRHVFPQRSSNSSIAAALAFQYVGSGSVIVYANQPRWAESVAKRMVSRLKLERPVDTSLITDDNREAVGELADYFRVRVGPDSVLTQAVAQGIAVHHGGIPQGLRLVLEHAFRTQTIRVLVATNTIAQGVNFPAKTVIVHSLPDTDAPIRDFWNLAGRAGRAMRETEGEVIILKTGELEESKLRRFLDRRRIEPVESQLLTLVRRLLVDAPLINPQTLEALLGSDDEGRTWRDVVRAVDGALLEAISEDAIGPVMAFSAAIEPDPPFSALVENLLATQQARAADSEVDGSRLEVGVRALMAARREAVLNAVPDGATRRRYARVGLSVESARYLDDSVTAVRAIGAAEATLSPAGLSSVIAVACGAVELREYAPERAAVLAGVWMETGSFLAVQSAAAESGAPFNNLDDAVGFVERVLVYRLPWVLNGLLRVLEPVGEPVDPTAVAPVLPEWITALPHYLRYGVNTTPLVWAMSLGLNDPGFARWLLDRFSERQGDMPRTFRALLDWAIENQLDVCGAAAREWPRYFSRLLGDVIERYARLDKLLSSSRLNLEA